MSRKPAVKSVAAKKKVARPRPRPSLVHPVSLPGEELKSCDSSGTLALITQTRYGTCGTYQWVDKGYREVSKGGKQSYSETYKHTLLCVHFGSISSSCR